MAGRIERASAALAARHSVDVPVPGKAVRDPELARVIQMESVATLLERVAVATGAMSEEEVMSTTAEGQGPAQPNEDGYDPQLPEGAKGATAEGAKAGEAEDLSALTVAELKERAKAAGVEGYSTMKKDELVEALGG